MTPRLLIGASPEDRHISDLLHGGLVDFADVTVWCAGDGILDATRALDFATFVLRSAPRERVLLGLGIVLGALGRERTLIVCPSSSAIDLPSDLHGVARATCPSEDDANFYTALGGVCVGIKEQVGRLIPPAPPAGQVARRLRRSLGTACSARPGQPFRIVDISLTGALLETFGEIPEQQILDLDFALENGRRIRVTAKVVRIQHPQWGRVGGVGVVFTRFEGDSQAILERYLEFDRGAPTS